MSDRPSARPILIADLEHRQDEVLRKLDDLNRRVEQAVSQSRVSADEKASFVGRQRSL
jgi:hypothetical protein